MDEEFFRQAHSDFRRNPDGFQENMDASWRKKAHSGSVNTVIEQV
jgi:hypothetical protein